MFQDQDQVECDLWPSFHHICWDSSRGDNPFNDYEFLKNLADQTLPISNWWIGITDRETEGTFKKESNQELSKNIANFFDKKPSSKKKGKKDCLYLRKGLKQANCNKMVDKTERDFLPQPLCMMLNMDKVWCMFCISLYAV